MNNHVDQEKQALESVDFTGALQQVGKQLQALRVEQKLGLEEVAERLRLSPEVLNAIESGDIDHLPAMTFVRGYIRSYARLLQVDAEDLLATLGESSSQLSRPLTVKKPINYRSPISLPSGKWITRLLVLTTAIVLLVFAYPVAERLLFSKEQKASTPHLQLPKPAGLAENTLDTNENQEAVKHDAVMNRALDQVDDAAVNTVEKEIVRADEKPKKAAQPVELSLYCKADSWVEVSAGGKKVLAGIMRAGTSEVINARPPFDILIGNAPSIDIKYNGIPFDTTPFRRGKVASFTLNN